MRCAKQRKSHCTGRGILTDGATKVLVLKKHIPTCFFNEDSAKQRSALAKKVINNPENPLTVFQKTRNE